MQRPTRLAALAAGLTLTATSALALHEGDPKVLDRQAPYAGPGYRRPSPFAPGAALPPGSTTAAGQGFSAERVRLLSWLPLHQLDGASSGNDCWGYTSPSGREYAVMCTQSGTVFVDLSDALNPSVVATRNGPNSLWRDVKVYGEYAYVVSEGGRGIQVFDLTAIDQGTVTLANTIDDVGSGATHNVAIDETTGMLYRCGGSQNGLRIYELNSDPTTPTFAGIWTTRYVHDVQVHTYTAGPLTGRSIAYACAGFGGGSVLTALDVLDVTDPLNVAVLATVQYPNPAYSHQGWLSSDLQYFYLGDELDEGGSTKTTTHVFDVSTPALTTYVTKFTNNNSAIGHNLYTKGDLLYEANYQSGLRVFDTSTDPLDPDEVAFFDTYPDGEAARFNGLWNVFPYFDSGLVIGSDLERGLFTWWVGDPALDVILPIGPPTSLAANGASVPVRIVEERSDLVAGSGRLFVDRGNGFEDFPLAALGGELYDADFPALTPGSQVNWYVAAQSTGGVPWSNPVDAPTTFYTSDVDSGGGTTNYCQGAANSVGAGATMGASGSTSVAANDLSLLVAGGVPSKFGIFFYGPGQISVPFGDGFRCVGAAGVGTFRLLPPIQADASGVVSRALDYSAAPANAGSGRIDAGSTWNFQFWYRDPMGPGGSGFNLTDGLSATFQP